MQITGLEYHPQLIEVHLSVVKDIVNQAEQVVRALQCGLQEFVEEAFGELTVHRFCAVEEDHQAVERRTEFVGDGSHHDLTHLVRVLKILDLLLLVKVQTDEAKAATPEQHRLLQSEVHHNLLSVPIDDDTVPLDLLPGISLREAEFDDFCHELAELLLLIDLFIGVLDIVKDLRDIQLLHIVIRCSE